MARLKCGSCGHEFDLHPESHTVVCPQCRQATKIEVQSESEPEPVQAPESESGRSGCALGLVLLLVALAGSLAAATLS